MADQPGVPMVMRCENERVVAYELYDERGRSLGRVLMPRDETIIGPQAGTVLLRRELPQVYPRHESGGGSPARAA
jgi:hypothetical protein